MADKRITDLPLLTTADAADQFAIVDDSANITKRVRADSMIPPATVKPQSLLLGAASASTAAQETTSSTTYVELTTSTSVTVTVNSAVLIIISCSGGNNANNGISYISFKASGANTIAGADANAAITVLGTVNAGGFVVGMTMSKVITGLTSGSTTFSLVYRVVSGSTGNFSNRSISVIPIG